MPSSFPTRRSSDLLRGPIVRPLGAGDRDERLAGLVETRLGIFDRAAGRHVVSGRPVDPIDERLGVDQLAGRAVEGEEEAVLRRVVEHFGGWAVQDRKSAVEGKSVSVRVDLGGRRIIKKKKK